ncbi:MAG TPA: SUMF1/EgtB/PvdO family nonheme iron enzyme [Desulfobacterales bacterium]|nr:SUMF1/EgtB/PvdO family nonheme iron enzyme [Desulfobacterales bacterium]
MIRRRMSAAAASILVLGTALLAVSCWNPLNAYLRGWAGIQMAWVQGGSLTLGSDTGHADEIPAHLVSVTSSEMSPFEITQGLYEAITGHNPSWNSGDPSFPVERVTWQDAVVFCNLLSTYMGYRACYTIVADTVLVDPSRDGYRLPTEAEWEYAARGGAYSSPGQDYAGSSTISSVAWYLDNAGDSIHPVGELAPNELGLYDMTGNVVEWCWDYYDPTWYSTNLTWTDTFGPSGTTALMNNGEWFVLKGGSCISPWEYSRTSVRFGNFADTSVYIDFGFRVVRRP